MRIQNMPEAARQALDISNCVVAVLWEVEIQIRGNVAQNYGATQPHGFEGRDGHSLVC